MERVILHADCDSFYASVELLHRPQLRAKPVAVGGDPAQRHGIVLAKNQLAKRCGVQTGQALWQARQKCPDLVFIPPHFHTYQRFSQMAREIYLEYTDQVEAFGLDENWLDVTGSVRRFEDGVDLAKRLQKRVLQELGITVSIGVSFNKIFAKLGSDYRKPYGVTVIPPKRFREMVWPLPVERLLLVGHATKTKLYRRGIRTIQDLAQADPENLQLFLGKNGVLLHHFANGLDRSPVKTIEQDQVIKSVGNSVTTPRDLIDEQEVKLMFYLLADCVALRLREQGLQGRLVSIWVRDNTLRCVTRQHKSHRFTDLSSEIAQQAMALFRAHYHWEHPVRSLGVSVGEFEQAAGAPVQLDLFADVRQRERLEALEQATDRLKRRFGSASVQRAVLLTDPALALSRSYEEQPFHPTSFFH